MVSRKNRSAPTRDRKYGRGLCGGCYNREYKAGRITEHPRSTRPAADVVEDWEFLRGQGYTKREAAERIGMRLTAFNRAILRHAARERAVSS
ncbi:hypothetical protein BAY59_10930 [Prauserella coralliicola]|nr:hypothetical protein BAY59_10930 [Prauserella coralliicola]